MALISRHKNHLQCREKKNNNTTNRRLEENFYSGEWGGDNLENQILSLYQIYIPTARKKVRNDYLISNIDTSRDWLSQRWGAGF